MARGEFDDLESPSKLEKLTEKGITTLEDFDAHLAVRSDRKRLSSFFESYDEWNAQVCCIDGKAAIGISFIVEEV